jgi:hypothetical protein
MYNQKFQSKECYTEAPRLAKLLILAIASCSQITTKGIGLTVPPMSPWHVQRVNTQINHRQLKELS